MLEDRALLSCEPEFELSSASYLVSSPSARGVLSLPGPIKQTFLQTHSDNQVLVRPEIERHIFLELIVGTI